jgi:hypothetical protein
VTRASAAEGDSLSTDATELTRLERWKGFKDRGNKRFETHHSVGCGANEKYPERQRGNVLLELDALIHGEQRIVLATHASKKVAVFDASPATSDDAAGAVAFEHAGEV